MPTALYEEDLFFIAYLSTQINITGIRINKTSAKEKGSQLVIFARINRTIELILALKKSEKAAEVDEIKCRIAVRAVSIKTTIVKRGIFSLL